jgi:hypothetical protein
VLPFYIYFDQLMGNGKLTDDYDTNTRYIHWIQWNTKQRHLVWLCTYIRPCQRKTKKVKRLGLTFHSFRCVIWNWLVERNGISFLSSTEECVTIETSRILRLLWSKKTVFAKQNFIPKMFIWEKLQITLKYPLM